MEQIFAKEDLSPCPFCGLVPVKSKNSETVRCSIHGGYTPTEEWNNAYCWKEINRLKALLGEAGGKMRKYVDCVNGPGPCIVEFDDMEETLAKIEKELGAENWKAKYQKGAVCLYCKERILPLKGESLDELSQRHQKNQKGCREFEIYKKRLL